MQILAGRNPLAKAASRGLLVESASLQHAAVYDLDVLQRLSLAESTLAGDHQPSLANNTSTIDFCQSMDPSGCLRIVTDAGGLTGWVTETHKVPDGWLSAGTKSTFSCELAPG